MDMQPAITLHAWSKSTCLMVSPLPKEFATAGRTRSQELQITKWQKCESLRGSVELNLQSRGREIMHLLCIWGNGCDDWTPLQPLKEAPVSTNDWRMVKCSFGLVGWTDGGYQEIRNLKTSSIQMKIDRKPWGVMLQKHWKKTSKRKDCCPILLPPSKQSEGCPGTPPRKKGPSHLTASIWGCTWKIFFQSCAAIPRSMLESLSARIERCKCFANSFLLWKYEFWALHQLKGWTNLESENAEACPPTTLPWSTGRWDFPWP